MEVGMTGNRDGMTKMQKDAFMAFLGREGALTLAHGDCVGADADAHDIAEKLDLVINIHPPVKSDLRAWKTTAHGVIHKEKPYFVRNRAIVNTTEVLCGFPKLMKKTRGGTWYTIGYAKDKESPLIIFWPDGSMKKYNF